MNGKAARTEARRKAARPTATDWGRVRADEAASVEPATDADDAPITSVEFARALKRRRGERGRQRAPTKVLLSIRFDRAIVDYFRGGGRGWQTRMNDALAQAIATGNARRSRRA